MTTTFAAIRDAQVAAIRALVPTRHLEHRFDVHRLDDDFDAWVEAHPDASFRRFEIASNFDWQLVGTTDMATDTLSSSVTVSVAYPIQLARYGVANRRALDELLEQDLVLIDGAIGRRGYQNYPAGQHGGIFISAIPVRLARVWIVRLVFQIEYDRSV
jgi:hypothetical protein